MSHMNFQLTLSKALINTPIGQMQAVADDKALYVLGFLERNDLGRELEILRLKTRSVIVSGRTIITELLEQELALYFAGGLWEFKTPLCMTGTPFQKSVWQMLHNIPCGQTWSYAQLAAALGKPSAFRAVAQANSANLLGIIVPCHRVINTNGGLGGYNGSVARKEWLLGHEKINALHGKKANGKADIEANKRIS